ncbi:MAG: hypothetical protein K6B46_03355 [Opitutales bacterium]|nr:hypothetical protein [Opitutales bacterium]
MATLKSIKKLSFIIFSLLLTALVVVPVAGCRFKKTAGITRVLRGPEIHNRVKGVLPVDIPKGLTNAEVLDIVEETINGANDVGKHRYWLSQWRVENRDPGNTWIQVGFSVRAHYMRVCYRIAESGKLIPDVPESVNLEQTKTTIHRKVPEWINSLNRLLVSQLYIAAKNKQSDSVPAEPKTL